MERDRLQDLIAWRDDPYRKPLIIRGCRQVGKSWLVRKFGEQFQHFVEINFEKMKAIHQYFSSDLHIDRIIEKLSLHTQSTIEPGKTLLFFDEIQTCEGAIQSLRYFKEDRPDLHIIAAGSLLDFSLNKLGLPVGRLQFMQIYPLSFAEFLSVNGYEEWRQYLFKQEHDPIIHHRLIELLKNYMWLGGMPAVVDAWVQQHDSVICQRLQDEIIESYQIDFHKYAKSHEVGQVDKVFEVLPVFLGEKMIYSKIDRDSRTEAIKNTLLLLETAGIAKRCFHTSANKQPLHSEQNDKKFKVFYFDIGIAQRLLGLDVKQWHQNPLPLSNQGHITEQFVAQELVAYSPFQHRSQLHYWHREAKSSNAEVDFIVLKDGHILPIEVKSNIKGSLKSTRLFLDEHPECPYGVKISLNPFAQQQDLLEIPLYALESWLTQPNKNSELRNN